MAVGRRVGAHRRRLRACLTLGSAYDASCPFAMSGSTLCFSSSEPSRIRAIVPSLFATAISDEDPHTRATSSITMRVATESAPWPPYATGTWIALKPDALSATSASSGNREFSSMSFAEGAIPTSDSRRVCRRQNGPAFDQGQWGPSAYSFDLATRSPGATKPTQPRPARRGRRCVRAATPLWSQSGTCGAPRY